MILGAGMAAIRAERAQQALISGSQAAEHIQRMHKRLVEPNRAWRRPAFACTKR
jgi:hypothetical protein